MIWFSRAAEGGDANTQTNLAYMYATGSGVKQDDAVAAKLYNQAAERGLPRAQAAFALMLSEGRGVKKSMAAAEQWYLQAAKGGAQDRRAAPRSIFMPMARSRSLTGRRRCRGFTRRR
ncbi:tetratricopeptide repeat protein [Breoghania sp.]|uniref:tetratricopeptide repeat protein n=1 Tax=Breoghania sp. TaxID=2065378 RepID=UPI00262512C0|nr:tetratricopeptide repeat protein [Breoghania sp.]MDJ0933184.1 tetratricopeptide repeat protein [Breoghania sp.]